MPILTLAITEDGLARLKRRAEQQRIASVRQYCIWLLANDAAKAEQTPPGPEPDTLVAA